MVGICGIWDFLLGPAGLGQRPSAQWASCRGCQSRPYEDLLEPSTGYPWTGPPPCRKTPTTAPRKSFFSAQKNARRFLSKRQPRDRWLPSAAAALPSRQPACNAAVSGRSPATGRIRRDWAGQGHRRTQGTLPQAAFSVAALFSSGSLPSSGRAAAAATAATACHGAAVATSSSYWKPLRRPWPTLCGTRSAPAQMHAEGAPSARCFRALLLLS